MKKIIANQLNMSRTIDRMAHQILENYSDTSDLCLIGVKTRGVYLANRLQERIKKFAGINLPVGILDITWYRDDLSKVAEDPQIKPSSVGFDIKDKNDVPSTPQLLEQLLFYTIGILEILTHHYIL